MSASHLISSCHTRSRSGIQGGRENTYQRTTERHQTPTRTMPEPPRGKITALRAVAVSLSWIARQCRPDEAGTASLSKDSFHERERLVRHEPVSESTQTHRRGADPHTSHSIERLHVAVSNGRLLTYSINLVFRSTNRSVHDCAAPAQWVAGPARSLSLCHPP